MSSDDNTVQMKTLWRSPPGRSRGGGHWSAVWRGGGEGGEGAGGRLIIDLPLLLIIISCTQTLLNTENDDSIFFTSIALAPPLVRRPYAPHIVHAYPLFAPLVRLLCLQKVAALMIQKL